METKWGRSSFKLGNFVAHGMKKQAEAWVEHNQRLFDRDEVWMRVFKENAGWDPISPGKGMFGSPPRDPGIWNPEWLKGHWDEDEMEELRVKPEHITPLNRQVTEWFFKTSQETGCAFEVVILATLKHTDKVGNGHLGHIVRQELLMFDEMYDKYPKAKIFANACNEWDAHHIRRDPWGRTHRLKLGEVNMWAVRRDRDGYGHLPLIVDHGGRDTFDYKVGPERKKYDWGMIHPIRSGDWVEAPPTGPIIEACHGQPYGSTESMYFVDPPDRARAEGWYRNRAGWQSDVSKQMQLYENLDEAGFSYIIVHDEKGAQCDVWWPREETSLEARLKEKFRAMPRRKFDKIITKGYWDILGRLPDPGGADTYNAALHAGLTKAQFEESLLRSEEYDIKNPEETDVKKPEDD